MNRSPTRSMSRSGRSYANAATRTCRRTYSLGASGMSATVDERGRDHRQADSAGGHRRELVIEPVEVAQGQVRDGMEPAPAVGGHFEGPPVPRAHVGLRRLEIADEVVLPDQAVVREQE